MAKAHEHSDIPAEVREAIKQFLTTSQDKSQPFRISAALGAIRRVFPDLDISDNGLVDAIASEASVAGFEIDYDGEHEPRVIKRNALERWDNEGGAVGKNIRRQ